MAQVQTLGVEEMQSHREENELPALARVGSCGLHVTHKALHRLVQDSPARRYERDWVDKISKTIQNLKLYLCFTFYSKKDSHYSQL